jgi:hypothetical protein
MLSEEEAAFLALPQSQLALQLDKRRSESTKQTLWSRVWSYRKGLLAASALIAGLLPLYELNVSAINYFHTRIKVERLLDAADELLSIGAREAAQEQMSAARALSPSSVRLQELQALLDLELALRKTQDLRSLGTLEVKHKAILPKSARVSYLIGTAYIGVDLNRAGELLKNAETLREKSDYLLAIRIDSAWIWLKSRRYDSDGDLKWLTEAEVHFKRACQLARSQSQEQVSRILVGLYHNYSFIEAARTARGEGGARERLARLSQQQSDLALKTGDHTLIGKTAARRAQEYKDAGELDRAHGLITYAIENAKKGDDDRGLFNNHYTLGQIEFNRGNFDAARGHFFASLAGAVAHNDMRLQSYNTLYLAKIAIVTADVPIAKAYLARSDVTAKGSADAYSIAEASILEVLLQGTQAHMNSWRQVSETMAALNVSKDPELAAARDFWRLYFRGEANAKTYDSLRVAYDRAFERALITNLDKKRANGEVRVKLRIN